MPKVQTPNVPPALDTSRALPSIFTRYGEALQFELRAALADRDGEVPPPLRYHMGWTSESGRPLADPEGQGKALRPTLCLFACEALGGDWRSALPAAAALEFIHNFSLVHDDIQDGDTERRHRRTLWVIWGQSKAVVAGVGMHCLAALALSRRRHSHTKALQASRLLVESSLAMIEGQCRDLSFEQRLDIGLDEYLEMVRLKTGALIRCSVETGALLASDNPAHVSAFAGYGAHLGRLFQIRDDVLGIWGVQQETGKPSGNDIRRRKKSFPIVFALERGSPAGKRRLAHIYKKETLQEPDVDEVLEILEDSGAPERAHQIISQEAELALDQLQEAPLTQSARGEAQELLDFLVARNF